MSSNSPPMNRPTLTNGRCINCNKSDRLEQTDSPLDGSDIIHCIRCHYAHRPMNDSLDKIADDIGVIRHEQEDNTNDREMTDTLPRRNLNEYDGAYDPEGRSDRERFAERDE